MRWGRRFRQYPDLTATLATNGHSLQNHTYSHPALNRISREAYVDEVTRADAAIRAAVGDAALPTTCLRPPYGAIDSATASIAAELGKSIVMWDVDPQDWRQPGADQIARHILSHAYPGAIILMHDGGGGRSQTVAALRTVLAELAARQFSRSASFRRVTLPDSGPRSDLPRRASRSAMDRGQVDGSCG